VDKITENKGIEIEEYSAGGALTGQELFPFIIVTILSGFLSEIGKDLWRYTKEQISKRVMDLESRTGIVLSPSGRKVSSVFFPTKIGNTTIIYYVHTEKGKVDLNFDDEQLKEAEAEIVLLNQSITMGGVYWGIDLKNLGKGGYLWPFKEIPSRLNKDNFCFLVEQEASTQDKIKFLAHLQAGRLFKEMERYENAIKHGEIAAKIAPQELAPCLLLAQIYDKLGDADKMLYELEKAAKIDVKNPDIRYLMASLYARKRDIKSSIRELENAVELGFNNVEAVTNEPNFKPFLGDPKIKALIEKMKSGPKPPINLDIF